MKIFLQKDIIIFSLDRNNSLWLWWETTHKGNQALDFTYFKVVEKLRLRAIFSNVQALQIFLSSTTFCPWNLFTFETSFYGNNSALCMEIWIKWDCQKLNLLALCQQTWRLGPGLQKKFSQSTHHRSGFSCWFKIWP